MNASPPAGEAIRSATEGIADARAVLRGDDGSHPRVVSVSAAHLAQRQESSSMPSTEIFLTPRVVNQATFDELAGEFRALIEAAGRTLGELRQILGQAGAVDGQINSASNQLQERLRLGARMLKAFQTQIDRVDLNLQGMEQRRAQAEEAEQRLNDRAAAAEQRVSDAMRRFEASMHTAAEAAIASFERQLRESHPRFADVEVKLSESAARAEAVAKMVEKAETTVSALSFNASQLVLKADAVVKDATGVIEQCEHSRQVLGEALLDAAENVDSVDKQAQQIVESIGGKLRELHQAERRAQKLLADAERAGENLSGFEALTRRLESLVDQLVPWEGLLLAEQPETGAELSLAGHAPLPDPLARLVAQVRSELMVRFSGLGAAMRDAAERLDAALSADARGPDAAVRRPTALHLERCDAPERAESAAAKTGVPVIHADRPVRRLATRG